MPFNFLFQISSFDAASMSKPMHVYAPHENVTVEEHDKSNQVGGSSSGTYATQPSASTSNLSKPPLPLALNKRQWSPVWEHMTLETDENGDQKARCKHCNKPFKYVGANGTSALRTYLNRCK